MRSTVCLSLLGLAVLLFPGCSPTRRVVVQTPPAPLRQQDPEPAPVVEEPSSERVRTQTEVPARPSAAEVVEEARKTAGLAESHYEGGQVDLGHRTYHAALDGLRVDSVSPEEQEELEQAYSEILDELQDREKARLDELSVLAAPPLDDIGPTERTPLEEMADLNLIAIEVDPQLRDLVHAELLNARFDFPIVLNKPVLRAVEYYQKRGRASMEKGLARAGRFKELFETTFAEFDLPRDLIYLSHVESLFNPRAYSRARAKGLWQFTSGTGRLYGLNIDWWVDERSDVVKSTRAAARYLKDLYEKFGDWYLVLAAYNSGPGRIERRLKRYGDVDYWEMRRRRMIPRETRNFVPSVLASIIIFNDPERYGFDVEPLETLGFDEIRPPAQVALETVAEVLGVPPSKVVELNPELRRNITPFGAPAFRLKVPEGMGPWAEAKLAALPPEKRLRFVHHRVQSGETVGTIARRYSSAIQAIAQVNRLRSVHRIRVGQDLMIPLLDSSAAAGRGSVVAANFSNPDRHVVRRGDSMARIARIYSLSLNDLLTWNRLDRSTIIYPGQTISLAPKGLLADGQQQPD